jgi:hypothetical protein
MFTETEARASSKSHQAVEGRRCVATLGGTTGNIRFALNNVSTSGT